MMAPSHHPSAPDDRPSAWVVRFCCLIRHGGQVLDLACGGGRHGRYLNASGHQVTMVDRDLAGLADLRGEAGIELIACDLEDGSPWPFAGRRFDGVVVTNYLHRPGLPRVTAAVAPGGALIYETFADGNQAFGRPRNPDFLLRPGELLDLVRPAFRVIAYEDVIVDAPRRAAIQHIAAVRYG